MTGIFWNMQLSLQLSDIALLCMIFWKEMLSEQISQKPLLYVLKEMNSEYPVRPLVLNKVDNRPHKNIER
jgi:hypothetical protein